MEERIHLAVKAFPIAKPVRCNIEAFFLVQKPEMRRGDEALTLHGRDLPDKEAIVRMHVGSRHHLDRKENLKFQISTCGEGA